MASRLAFDTLFGNSARIAKFETSNIIEILETQLENDWKHEYTTKFPAHYFITR